MCVLDRCAYEADEAGRHPCHLRCKVQERDEMTNTPTEREALEPMTNLKNERRKEIARTLLQALIRQTEKPTHSANVYVDGESVLDDVTVDGQVDFLRLADAILALPPLPQQAEAVAMSDDEWPRALARLKHIEPHPDQGIACVGCDDLAMALDRLEQFADVALGNAVEVSRLLAVEAEAQARVEALEAILQKLADMKVRFDDKDGNQADAYNSFVKGQGLTWTEVFALLSGSTPKPAGVEITEERIGPHHQGPGICRGCPAFETQSWREPSGDGETFDNGQYAWCRAADRKSMGAYHYDTSPTPSWCPALTAALSGDA